MPGHTGGPGWSSGPSAAGTVVACACSSPCSRRCTLSTTWPSSWGPARRPSPGSGGPCPSSGTSPWRSWPTLQTGASTTSSSGWDVRLPVVRRSRRRSPGEGRSRTRPAPRCCSRAWGPPRRAGARELRRLATGARSAAAKAGCEVDGGRFHPHVTLARTRRPVQATRWLRVLDAYPRPDLDRRRGHARRVPPRGGSPPPAALRAPGELPARTARKAPMRTRWAPARRIFATPCRGSRNGSVPGVSAATWAAPHEGEHHGQVPVAQALPRRARQPVNDVPMDQWTPDEVDAHMQYMTTSPPGWRAPASSSTARRCRRRACGSATTARAGRRSPTARSPRPRT